MLAVGTTGGPAGLAWLNVLSVAIVHRDVDAFNSRSREERPYPGRHTLVNANSAVARTWIFRTGLPFRDRLERIGAEPEGVAKV